jgi:hypothetical protein
MNPVWNIVFGILVVACSAMATYIISISRERLWLRSKKSEELYHKAEEVYVDLSSFFTERYDLTQMAMYPRSGSELSTLNRHIVDLRILVGLYFPDLGSNLSAVLAAIATAFDRLRLAEASDESNREHALQALDFALSSLKDSLDQFKNNILSIGRVDKIGRVFDMVLNRTRHGQSERVLSVAA